MAFNEFGVKGGYWGSGQDLQENFNKVMDRLLSPEEFNRLDNAVTSAYGGYMGYLNAYAKQQRAKKAIPEAYQAVQAGTYEPFDLNVSYGAPTSTRSSRIPAAAEAAKGARIPTTIHRDISGRTTQELAGGGIKRDMGGEVIPQTSEQYAAYGKSMPKELSVPSEALDSEIGFLKKLAEKKTLESDIALNKREEAAHKLALSEKKVGVQQEQFGKTLTQKEKALAQKEKLQQLRLQHQEKLLLLRQNWQTGEKDLDRELRINLQEIRGEQSAERQQEYIDSRIRLLDIAEQKDISEEARRAIVKEKEFLRDWEQEKAKMDIEQEQFFERQPYLTSRQKEAAEKRAQANAQTPPVAGAKKAQDGFWYVQKNGKWFKVE